MVLAAFVTVLVIWIWRVLVIVSSSGARGCCHRPATAAKAKEGNRMIFFFVSRSDWTWKPLKRMMVENKRSRKVQQELEIQLK